MSNKSITINGLNNNEEYVIGKRKKHIHTNRFTMLGVEMDAIKILAAMRPQEARVIGMIVDNLEYKTNRSDLSMVRKDENDTEKVQFSTGYGRLKKLGVLIRIKWNVYLVNPLFILPPAIVLDAVMEDWEFYTTSH